MKRIRVSRRVGDDQGIALGVDAGGQVRRVGGHDGVEDVLDAGRHAQVDSDGCVVREPDHEVVRLEVHARPGVQDRKRGRRLDRVEGAGVDGVAVGAAVELGELDPGDGVRLGATARGGCHQGDIRQGEAGVAPLVQPVAARAAIDDVRARAAADHVVARAAGQDVGALVADDRVAEGRTRDVVEARQFGEVARLATGEVDDNRLLRGREVEGVRAASALQDLDVAEGQAVRPVTEGERAVGELGDRHRDGHRDEVDGVVPLVQPALDDRVDAPAVAQDVGVVAVVAGHGVVAGTRVEDVVQLVAVERVVARAADDVLEVVDGREGDLQVVVDLLLRNQGEVERDPRRSGQEVDGIDPAGVLVEEEAPHLVHAEDVAVVAVQPFEVRGPGEAIDRERVVAGARSQDGPLGPGDHEHVGSDAELRVREREVGVTGREDRVARPVATGDGSGPCEAADREGVVAGAAGERRALDA